MVLAYAIRTIIYACYYVTFSLFSVGIYYADLNSRGRG